MNLGSNEPHTLVEDELQGSLLREHRERVTCRLL